MRWPTRYGAEQRLLSPGHGRWALDHLRQAGVQRADTLGGQGLVDRVRLRRPQGVDAMGDRVQSRCHAHVHGREMVKPAS